MRVPPPAMALTAPAASPVPTTMAASVGVMPRPADGHPALTAVSSARISR